VPALYQAYPIALQGPQRRFDYFRALVDELFCPMQIQPRATPVHSFDGLVEAAQLGEVQLARVATAACVVSRRAQDIARVERVSYLVKFQTKGEALWRQRNREVHLRPGDFVVCSVIEPYRLEFRGAYEMPVLALTEQTMRRLTPDPEQFLGVRLSGDDADCGLLSGFVAQVSARMSSLSDAMIQRVETNILDLLGGVLSARTRAGGLGRTQQLTHIKSYIEKHLHDRRLSPRFLAAAFGISTRCLHGLFAGDDLTIGRYIRRLRARGCRQALAADTSAQRSLTDHALSWGFYDLSHMTRCFRGEFGMTPAEARERARAGQPDS
jgi:AraC-like DNA-binding protein